MGYNGILTGTAIAMWCSEDATWGWKAFLPVIFCSALSTIFTVAIGRVTVSSFGVAPFTFPFHLATWIWLLGVQGYANFPDGFPVSPTIITPINMVSNANNTTPSYDAARASEAILRGIGQVWLINNPWSGAVFVFGIALATPISAVMALFGSGIGVTLGVALGASASAIENGLWGFNPTLVMIGIGGLFYVLDLASLCLGIFGSVASALMAAALGNALAPIGIPALTFPAAATMLSFTLIGGSVKALMRVELGSMTVAEDHIRRVRLSQLVASRFNVLAHLGQLAANTSEDIESIEKTLVPYFLCDLASRDDSKTVIDLIAAGADPNSADYDGRTPLHLAASEGHYDLCRVLLEAKADTGAVDRWGSTPLMDCYRERRSETAELLLESGGASWSPDWGERAIYWFGAEICKCSAQGDIKGLQILARSKADLSSQDYDGRTGLHLAACEGQSRVVEMLLNHGVDPNPVDRFNVTPLAEALQVQATQRTRAAQAEAYEARRLRLGLDALRVSVRLLEAAGGVTKGPAHAPTASNGTQRPPQLHAIPRPGSHPSSASVAESHPTAVEPHSICDNDGLRTSELSDLLDSRHVRKAMSMEMGAWHASMSPETTVLQSVLLCDAACKGDVTEMKSLLSAGASPDSSDYDRRSALHLAAAEGELEMVRFLLRARANPNLKDRWGATPLAAACQKNHISIIDLLSESDCHLGIESYELAMLLCDLAADGNNVSLAAWLKARADPNAADYDSRTPLHIAVSEGHVDTVKLLLQNGADPELPDRWGVAAKAINLCGIPALTLILTQP